MIKIDKLNFFLLSVAILILTFIVFNSVISPSAKIDKSLVQVIEIVCYSEDGNKQSQGTGFFIDDEGLIITNKHVVIDSSSEDFYFLIEGRTIFEEEYQKLNTINVSSDHDLAILKLTKTGVKFESVKFKNSDKLKYGSSIYTIGNTYGYGLSYLEGNISSPKRTVEYQNRSITAIQLNIDIEVGSSGSPVFDAKGKVIGVATFRILDPKGSRMPGMNFALPSNTIIEYIETLTLE